MTLSRNMIMCLACKEKDKYQILRGNNQRLFVLQLFVSLTVATVEKWYWKVSLISACKQAKRNMFFSLSAFPIVFSSFMILEALKKRENKDISGLGRLPCFQEEIGSISWRKTMYLFQAENKIENSHDMQ